MNPRAEFSESEIFAIERPSPQLLKAFFIFSLVLGPFFFIPFIPLFFRYHTLRYRFDGEGIHKRWGFLFRREINLTYARIQDIHLRSNPVERWLGLARIEVQTASGGAGAEMTLEGLLDFEAVRDYLYARMRGVQQPATKLVTDLPSEREAPSGKTTDQLTETLRAVAEELRALRETLDDRSSPVSNRDAGHD